MCRRRCNYIIVFIIVIFIIIIIIIIIDNNVTVTAVASQALPSSSFRSRHHCRRNCSHHINSAIVAETVDVFTVTVSIAHRRSGVYVSSLLQHRHRHHNHHYHRHHHCQQRCRHRRIIIGDVAVIPTASSTSS